MTEQLTVQAERYRLPERFLDFIASISLRLGLPLTDSTADSIVRLAERQAGRTDWGDPQAVERWRLLRGLVEQAPFTPLAHAFLRQVGARALRQRLETEAYIERYPEVLDIPIERPVFVLGFPRSGTTVLQNLLASGGGRRGLQFWELTTPVPVSTDPAEDRRIRKRSADRILAMAYYMAPEMGEVHAIGSTTLEECWPLFYPTFSSLNLDFQSGITAYGDFLYRTDMDWAYRQYRRSLQVLLHRHPAKQLVLKCPEHLWFLDSLLHAFPDACVVWTHRDPVSSIASYCSLISLNRRTYYDGYDPVGLGAHITRRFHEGVTRAMAVRDGAGSSRFLDMNFSELVKDQVGAAEAICRHFDLPCDAQDVQAMNAWLETDRADHKGAHKYSVERYGIDPEAVLKRFGPYIERFGISTADRD